MTTIDLNGGDRVAIFLIDATIGRFRKLVANRFAWCSVTRRIARQRRAWNSTTALIRDVCQLAGATTLIDDTRVSLARAGVLEAIQNRDDAVLFEWLMELVSYQGVSDAIAYGYMERFGRIGVADIVIGLHRKRLCPKLQSYWQFYDCGYRKSEGSCAEPMHRRSCPLPRHPLRNGRLNQTAYSLFM